MKVAVSIPDDVFEEADRLAEEQGTSRSALYARAVRDYLTRHAPERITEAINAVVDAVGDKPDPFLARAARLTAERNEW